MKLQEGKHYTLNRKIKSDKEYIMKTMRMKLIKKYPHHALFENKMGFRESFKYSELKRLLKGATT